MCDQHHKHTHTDDVKAHEDAHIAEFMKVQSITSFLSTKRVLRSPVDVYEHVPEFKRVLNIIGIHLVWGIKASHKYKHAYNMTEYTILTDHDFDKYEESALIWKNYDLFREENS